MILIYRVFSTLLYPFLFLYIYYRKVLGKEDPNRFKEKILLSHFKVNEKDNYKLIWFHAASIGEFKSIIPIIKELIKDKNLRFLITTTTLSSGNLANIELKKFNNVEHRYLPLDVPFLIDRFLYLWKPDKIFLVDSEIWPNLILKAQKYKISISLFNARLTNKSFKRWMYFPKVAKQIFDIFEMSICSNLETKAHLDKLDLKNVFFEGNFKLADKINVEKIKNINSNILQDKKFWFAASIHKEEDIFCLKTHLELKKKFKDLITIIAPRHIDRVSNIKTLSQKLNLTTQVLNKNETILQGKEVIIINYFGALKDYFKYAKSVFIGKSMIYHLRDVGGQNPIEAAKLMCKIYHGPYVYNFEEIYEILKKKNISKKIKDHKELSENLYKDLANTNKKDIDITDPIKDLGNKTLTDTMKHVNDFIKNNAH